MWRPRKSTCSFIGYFSPGFHIVTTGNVFLCLTISKHLSIWLILGSYAPSYKSDSLVFRCSFYYLIWIEHDLYVCRNYLIERIFCAELLNCCMQQHLYLNYILCLTVLCYWSTTRKCFELVYLIINRSFYHLPRWTINRTKPFIWGKFIKYLLAE
jgi:hypothetical protein